MKISKENPTPGTGIVVVDMWHPDVLHTELPTNLQPHAQQTAECMRKLCLDRINPLLHRARKLQLPIYQAHTGRSAHPALSLHPSDIVLGAQPKEFWRLEKSPPLTLYYCGFAVNNCVLCSNQVGALKAARHGHQVYVIMDACVPGLRLSTGKQQACSAEEARREAQQIISAQEGVLPILLAELSL